MHIAKVPKLFQPFYCRDLIRLGKKNDGGYLVNSYDILAAKKLVSFGIGEDLSFETDFLEKNNCPLVAYDENAKVDLSFFKDNKKLILENITEKSMLLNILEDCVFLKCDIEGSEYKILDEIIKYSSRLTGMVFEFHAINEKDNFDSLINFISKVKQKLVHIHVNNYFYYKAENRSIPDIFELTFTSSDNICYDPRLSLPHILDMPNNPKDADFKLVF